ncbi:PWWP domain-containing DNA repair factor 3A isoform X1 [Tachysurus fulvidraco]|uniref:PWWP domain-containing DNA repair factor 3A isoform X1 n=1 Tax=Tachysurus fulvidraco TaxID=1234273 RepID=UPI000F4E46AC|nr:PWWP domain-containing DNA repair factor 3A isoform X1 [Tachysurus fulvidraco]XP_027009401.1 PWWP domain-containing DNA repair factor 3A isoform X1 [Tachysurus fulvidraco]XP_027009403.1 PWWP domain-containing DNA repair factor 3A isoform X1 [Tachysurus fulvidraco]XP_047679028.1 PWWP domain-containing DNA repair factor 3A isoform X1 [Tachysurus fulvidraco]
MRASKKYSCKGRRQKISNQQASVLETNSELSSKPHAVPSAEAVKKTRGRTARVVAQHPDTEPTPVSSVSHTVTNGHLSQNTSTRPQRGRKKKTERSDFTPSERSDPCADADTRRTRHQKATITPPPPPPTCTRRYRAAKETSTHATLLCLGSPQDITVSSPTSDSGVRTPRRGRPPKLCLSSTPQCSRTLQSQPQISPITKTLPKRVRPQNPETQQRKRTRKKAEQEVVDTLPFKRQRKKRSAKAELPQSQRIRTRFVLEDSEHQDTEETTSTSDLSVELSVQEDKLSLTHSLSEEDEEDEELPSFLQQIRQKPSSIREGLCVWCKLRKYPFWPAMVKSVNRKTKKASIVFIDQFLIYKGICKGLSVSLRTLKPFDCEEYHHFVDVAKEKYGESIMLGLDLISDYNIRIGCGSFVGSIIDYVADDISQPIRSQYSKASSDLLSPTQCLMEQQDGDSEFQDLEEHPDLLQEFHMVKKVLPDRALAARNRANQRLVDFIVRKRGAQDRLLAVIRGQQKSRWLRDLHSSTRLVVGQVYLEDEKQVDAVYSYLEELFKSAAKANRRLEKSDRIRYILDVLFPEALISAISAVDSVSLDKAEEKYRQGPRHSNRERQEFDLMIEQQMKLKAADWSR